MIDLRKARPVQEISESAAAKFISVARKNNWPEDTLKSLFMIRFKGAFLDLLSDKKLAKSA